MIKAVQIAGLTPEFFCQNITSSRLCADQNANRNNPVFLCFLFSPAVQLYDCVTFFGDRFQQTARYLAFETMQKIMMFEAEKVGIGFVPIQNIRTDYADRTDLGKKGNSVFSCS